MQCNLPGEIHVSAVRKCGPWLIRIQFKVSRKSLVSQFSRYPYKMVFNISYVQRVPRSQGTISKGNAVIIFRLISFEKILLMHINKKYLLVENLLDR